jgi:manganese efflux pump family protein
MVIELLLISVSLAMDAFAVSIGKGLSTRENTLKIAISCGIWFGLFQTIMPIIGFIIGSAISSIILEYSGIVALVLLALVGANMIREALKNEDEDISNSIDPKEMFVLAIATSIDALVVGVSYVAIGANILLASIIIGVVTFLICFFGAFLGNKIGTKFEKPAAIAGGIILILIGLKIFFIG